MTSPASARAGSAGATDTRGGEREQPPSSSRRLIRAKGWLNRLTAGDLDVRNTWQIVAGAVLLPLGIAVILLGWAGAAHGRVDQQQIPYIISGGVLGLALVVIGGFFFWAHWLYRIYDQADLHHKAAMREQAEFYRAMLAIVGQRAGTPLALTDPSANASGAAFVATPNGTSFHLPDCPIVVNRTGSVRPVTRDEAGVGMSPCRICEPLETS